MPTKPNSAGEQQQYDPNTGKYGSSGFVNFGKTKTDEERKKPENSEAEKNKFNELIKKHGKSFDFGEFTVTLDSQELKDGGFVWRTIITLGSPDNIKGSYNFIEPDKAIIIFNEKQEAERRLGEKIKLDFEEYDKKKKDEAKKINSQIKEFRQKSNEQQLEMLKDSDFFELYFSHGGRDKPLYDEVDRDSKGGYQGMSMSNRAIKAYESGQAPLSKWTKEEILEKIDDDGNLEPLMPLIEKMSEKEMKENFLENTAWHHTSGFFNKTSFYGIKSPKEIAYYIMQKPTKKFENFGKKE